jgi:hypothetical protein
VLCLSAIYDLGNNQIGDLGQNEILEVILEKTVIHRRSRSIPQAESDDSRFSFCDDTVMNTITFATNRILVS